MVDMDDVVDDFQMYVNGIFLDIDDFGEGIVWLVDSLMYFDGIFKVIFRLVLCLGEYIEDVLCLFDFEFDVVEWFFFFWC